MPCCLLQAMYNEQGTDWLARRQGVTTRGWYGLDFQPLLPTHAVRPPTYYGVPHNNINELQVDSEKGPTSRCV